MFKNRSSLLICQLAVAQVLSWAVFLLEKSALAQSGGNQCCNPAHTATPTPPPGATTSCFYGNFVCKNVAGTNLSERHHYLHAASTIRQNYNCYYFGWILAMQCKCDREDGL